MEGSGVAQAPRALGSLRQGVRQHRQHRPRLPVCPDEPVLVCWGRCSTRLRGSYPAALAKATRELRRIVNEVNPAAAHLACQPAQQCSRTPTCLSLAVMHMGI